MTRQARGFSLIEMAFVLIIVTLLLGGLLVPFATQVEQKRIAETQKAMEEIKEALLGFAVANGRLPCPDMVVGAGANDGLEDPLGGPCAAAATEGNLPWATLGVANSDAWGNRFGYRVTINFATFGGITLGPPPTPGTLRICTDAACGSLLANSIPAVIYSLGKNGQSFSCTPVPAGRADECENRDSDNDFVSRIITGPGAPAGEFDDLVVWLSPNVLFNRMVAAGRLP
ncbi:MAG: type II secretion system protein [Hydrogenophilales bacterium]|nr:type II secretion system protein [Hydrogenophilales bacterium]